LITNFFLEQNWLESTQINPTLLIWFIRCSGYPTPVIFTRYESNCKLIVKCCRIIPKCINFRIRNIVKTYTNNSTNIWQIELVKPEIRSYLINSNKLGIVTRRLGTWCVLLAKVIKKNGTIHSDAISFIRDICCITNESDCFGKTQAVKSIWSHI
jgi:hypothetical protein